MEIPVVAAESLSVAPGLYKGCWHHWPDLNVIYTFHVCSRTGLWFCAVSDSAWWWPQAPPHPQWPLFCESVSIFLITTWAYLCSTLLMTVMTKAIFCNPCWCLALTICAGTSWGLLELWQWNVGLLWDKQVGFFFLKAVLEASRSRVSKLWPTDQIWSFFFIFVNKVVLQRRHAHLFVTAFIL